MKEKFSTPFEQGLMLFCLALDDLELDSYILRSKQDKWQPSDAFIRDIRSLAGKNRMRILPGLVMIAMSLSKQKPAMFRAAFDRKIGKRVLRFNPSSFAVNGANIAPPPDMQLEWHAAIEAGTNEERFRLMAAFIIMHFSSQNIPWFEANDLMKEIQNALNDPFLRHVIQTEKPKIVH